MPVSKLNFCVLPHPFVLSAGYSFVHTFHHAVLIYHTE